MARVLLALLADEELVSIWRFIALDHQSLENADHVLVLRELNSTMQRLAENPLVGQKIGHNRPGLRMFTKWRYVIFFEPITDGVQIFRVVHGSRAWEDVI